MLDVSATPDPPDAAANPSRGAAAFVDAMATVAHHSSELIALLDRNGTLVYANPAASLTFGIALEEAIGSSASSFLHPDDVSRVTKRFGELLATPGATMTDTVRFVSALQEIRILEIVSTNCLHNPHIAGVIVNGRDVTERRQLETDLLEQSLHDALTGLPNRTLFIDRAERLLALANRDQIPVSVLFVDLDNFKTFNDGMGHPAGDELLVAVSRRMANTVRAEDLLCRFGGDEFVVLVDPRPPSIQADALAERLADVLRTPFEIDGRVISVTASVGIANGVDLSVEDLVRDADIAMYQAKAAGKNQVVAFAPEMVDIANERLQLVIDLQRAIEEAEFVVLFQPIIELGDQAVTGMEALVRWQHPTRGRLSPFEFIPAAEENGMIVDIGRLVLRQACEQAVSWRFAERDLTLSVNLSARQLSSATLLEDVSSILDETGFDAASLVLEITETTIMQDAEAAVGRLSALKELGVRLAIDDFGTGYSSLSYLRKIPVDILKIDRSFVADLHDSTEAVAIVHSLIDLGRTLDLDLVAEGVELEDQLQELRSQHCNKAQGFLFARPLDAEQIDVMFDTCIAGRALHLPAHDVEVPTPSSLVH
jgi:diguanylate cyclase (GGDEF)-like protein/PAS domain S-box-containing protein